MATTFLRRRLPAILANNFHTNAVCGSGYVVLIPESPSELPESHPLLKVDGLPDLSTLTTNQCVEALRKLTLDYESGLWKIEEQIQDGDNNFEGSVLPALERLGNSLDAVWGIAKVLYLCGGTPSMPPETYEKLHHSARSAKAKRFFSPYIHLAALKVWEEFGAKKSQVPKEEDREMRRIVGKFELEGRLNGLCLKEDSAKQQFNKIRSQLVEETARFNGKLSVATQLFSHIITDPTVVRDFPVDLLEDMAAERSQPRRGPWKVTLVDGVAPRFMEHCPDPNLRWNVWQASVRRASAHGPTKEAASSMFDSLKGKKTFTEEDLNNSSHVEKIRDLRKEQAKLLGFESAAHMCMETKMAGSVDSVRAMIASLLVQAKPAQEEELSSLLEFARERGHSPSAPLEMWDVPYWRRKRIRSSLGGLEEDSLRAFFPLEKVLNGLFNLCAHLFSLEVVPLPLPLKGATAWHPDVRLYALNDSCSGEMLGAFYLDMWSRPGSKLRSSEVPGWMLGLRNRMPKSIPLATLVFNFPTPSENRPCLLSPREVRSLFQKFGHVLQHLLCSSKNSEVFGLNNVEWDAVDICSNFMALWLTNVSTLRAISGHYESGDPITDEIAKVIATEDQQLAGFDLCRELYLSDLDLELHTSTEFWMDIVRRLWPMYHTIPLDKRDSHVCSFRAAFESGSSGGSYFSKPWSLMVASDIFGAFSEDLVSGGSQQKTRIESEEKVGTRFRSTFFSLGGSCHPGEIFRRFRGRDPSPSALLSSLGLKTKKQQD